MFFQLKPSIALLACTVYACIFICIQDNIYVYAMIRYYLSSHTHAYSGQINAAGHHLVLILMQALSFWINLLESYSQCPLELLPFPTTFLPGRST